MRIEGEALSLEPAAPGDSGRATLRLHFLRGDRRRVREAVVPLAVPVEAAA